MQATLGMAGAIIGEAALSFLGLGVQPPTPSWGTMLNGGRAHLLDAPHLTIFPGLAIALLVLGFNFLGDGLAGPDRPESRSRRVAVSALTAFQRTSSFSCVVGESRRQQLRRRRAPSRRTRSQTHRRARVVQLQRQRGDARRAAATSSLSSDEQRRYCDQRLARRSRWACRSAAVA